MVKPTNKPLSNRLVANEAAVSVVQVTFRDSLIECEQVQVDSIIYMQVESTIYLTGRQHRADRT